jgi:short-subunit dehydrogenase
MKTLKLHHRTQVRQTVLITGAASGNGAAEASRFAHLGYNLVLVDRDFVELENLAHRLWAETGVNVEIEVADFANPSDVRRIEERLRANPKIAVPLVLEAASAKTSSGLFRNRPAA